MSLEAMVWVLSGDAPVSDVNEYAVLGAMADKADPDGCGTWLSKETISARVHVSEETVKRCWRAMAKRGLIARGDQNLVRHYRADRRPTVYDLLIPYTWFSNIDRINAERDRLGRPPLTPADRPPIQPAPAKKQRADKGKPRPKKKTTTPPDQGAPSRGVSEFPREDAPAEPHGGTTSSPRGNYKSSPGELEDPQNRKSNQSSNSGKEDGPPVRPSVQVDDARAHETDGRTGAVESQGEEETRPKAGNTPPSRSADEAAPASGVTDHRQATPGVEVLRRVAQRREELTLAGKVLLDQARKVDGLLVGSYEAGDPWKPAQLVDILSAPLDGPIRVSPGAVISARIGGLPLTPNAAAGMLPWQAATEDRQPPRPPRKSDVPDAADRTVAESVTRRTRGECPECGADSPGDEVCGACQGWPPCSGGCGRRLRHGETCDYCADDVHYAESEAPWSVDGTCPGYEEECGRPVLTLGLCGRCRVKAEAATRTADAAWETAKAQAFAAVKEAEEARQPDRAPF